MAPFASLAELARGLRAGDFSSRDLTSLFLDRIARHQPVLNGFISVAADRALAQAEAADQRLARQEGSALTGIPIAHKDIFCTAGLRTTCGSRMLENFIAPYDATVVARLDAAGAVTLGKTNCDEFAMGSSNENSYFGPVANPWDTDRVPGGSIRQPVAFCGLTGIKPTYGRVSRYGMVAFASSLDQGGVFARSAADAALVLAAMSGFDPLDSTASEHRDPWLEGLLASALEATPDAPEPRPPVIGLPQEYLTDLREGQRQLDEARRILEQAGCEFRDIHLPHTAAAIPAYYIIAGAEASTNLSRYDGVRFGHRCDDPDSLEDLYRRSRSEGFGAEVKRRILTGTYALSVGYFDAYYLKAQKLRRLIQNDFLTAFEQVDLILTPTAPGTAFPRGELTDDPVAMYQQDIFTTPASLAGLPAMSLPCGFEAGLPLGMQLIGPHFGERVVLETGVLFQQHTGWHDEVPAGFAP